jgi:hypothetical protein
MLALWQSALVRGWMAVSAAKTGKAAIRAIPKAKIEAINFNGMFTDQLSSWALINSDRINL